jgi:hypothetical protein
MWDEDDHTSRWVQGLCAIFLTIFAVVDAYFAFSNVGFFYFVAGITLFISSVRIAWRCTIYAITGRNNINRDDF